MSRDKMYMMVCGCKDVVYEYEHHKVNDGPKCAYCSERFRKSEIIKMEQKMWAINGDKVRFTATGNPRDWTTGSDAGFLPVGLKQKGSDNALALGQYKEGN